MIKSVRHLGMFYFFHLISCEDFISKSLSLVRAYTYFQLIMPPRRAIRGHPRRNVEELKVTNAPEYNLMERLPVLNSVKLSGC